MSGRISGQTKKNPRWAGFFNKLVGETGFEPAAFSSRTRRATWLRYTPMSEILLHRIFERKPLLLKGTLLENRSASQLLDGAHLILVDACFLAIELLEFVEP